MAVPPVRADISIYIGDDYAHTCTFLNADETPRDMSAGTFAAQIRLPGPPIGDPVLTFDVDTTDAATGIVVLGLTAVQTLTLTAASYRMDLQHTVAGVVQTLFTAVVTGVQDVTR